MKFDSVITFLFIIAFFILPSILKQVRARKKKTAGPSNTPEKKPSIFGKIGEQIRQFVQELEDQAQQQKKATPDQGSEWDKLAEDEDLDSVFERTREDADFGYPQTIVSKEKMVPEKVVPPAKRRYPREKELPIKKKRRRLSGAYCLKSNPLQNAIVWSEILSKPLALRDGQKI